MLIHSLIFILNIFDNSVKNSKFEVFVSTFLHKYSACLECEIKMFAVSQKLKNNYNKNNIIFKNVVFKNIKLCKKIFPKLPYDISRQYFL